VGHSAVYLSLFPALFFTFAEMKTRMYLSLALLTSSCLLSCTKAEKTYTRQELQLKTDSILRVEVKKLRRQAKEDLDRRLPIELKPKVDSILKISYDVPPVPEMEGDAGALDSSAAEEQAPQKPQPAPGPKPDLPKPPPLNQ
jgi:hypothetical protein